MHAVPLVYSTSTGEFMAEQRGKVVVIGAGPGGVTAGMILSSKGYDVEVYEKEDCVGGRNQSIDIDGYTFELGPTFLMMPDILKEMFEISGRDVHDYMNLMEVDPLYRVVFGDGREFLPSHQEPQRTKEQLQRLFPEDADGFDKFMERESTKYDRLMPCLQVPYESYFDLFSTDILHALPYLDAHKSMLEHMGRYFDAQELKIAFTFQSKYLGMSPWECPGIFSLIPYAEHGMGIWHPEGGLNQISKAMAEVMEEEGGRIHLSEPVDQLMMENGTVEGVQLEGGEQVDADRVIINADFGVAMQNLVPEGELDKWTPEQLEDTEYSCSTFMLYLGMDRIYPDVPHHNILLSSDYKKNVDQISQLKELPEDPAIYMQNACVTDPGLAPEGKSTIYILAPVPNNRSGIDWDEVKEDYRETVLDLVEDRGDVENIRENINVERMVTPADWERMGIFEGATFNMAHSVSQMLMFRPHNRFEELEDCYLVGGGTHPGSGLPTVFESARISSGLILQEDGFEYV